ncbi:hypothetical protein C1H76_7520 [Elsinoe australis]|uniref:Transmembrane protein n=1 Tax=Elsinoe australis TaxID=40998 RepID=A0A4U7AZ25_9PEZI|nr:hypothetical protein C1H76_7520 [Elsinoe australis]
MDRGVAIPMTPSPTGDDDDLSLVQIRNTDNNEIPRSHLRDTARVSSAAYRNLRNEHIQSRFRQPIASANTAVSPTTSAHQSLSVAPRAPEALGTAGPRGKKERLLVWLLRICGYVASCISFWSHWNFVNFNSLGAMISAASMICTLNNKQSSTTDCCMDMVGVTAAFIGVHDLPFYINATIWSIDTVLFTASVLFGLPIKVKDSLKETKNTAAGYVQRLGLLRWLRRSKAEPSLPVRAT